MSPLFLSRNVNEGFSGGEKKRNEILQLKMLKPKFAILDEIDSGLDVDALRIVGHSVSEMIKQDQFGVILITHYQRILDYINPTHVHIMMTYFDPKIQLYSILKTKIHLRLKHRKYKMW